MSDMQEFEATSTLFGGNALNEFSYQKSGNKISTTNPDGTKGQRSDYNLTISEVFPENASNRIPTVAISGLSSIGSGQIIGIEYIGSGTLGRVNSGWVRNITAAPERIQMATTRSG
jgi:hypothetical protein